MSRVKRVFISGLLAALPLALTIFIVGWLLSFLNQYIGPSSGFGRFLTSFGVGTSASQIAYYLIGLAIIGSGIYFLGLIVESRVGPWLIEQISGLVRRIPVVSSIYELAARFVSVVDTRGGANFKNMSSGWCHFGGKPGAAVLALIPSKKPIRMGEEDYLGILIPTAPVPFGGALIYVPAAWVEMAEGGVDELMSVYVSMGITPPAFLPRDPGGTAPQ
jgi:uncharacterized membrane protein